MSNLAYHAQHFKAGSVGAVGKHNYEKRGAKDEHSNQDIDPSRSHLNFQPQETEGSLYLAAKNRIQEACTGRVTAASNWITETIVYPPEDVVDRYKASGDDAELRRYYADVLAWHQKEFGEKNILNATVHLDETTPICTPTLFLSPRTVSFPRRKCSQERISFDTTRSLQSS